MRLINHNSEISVTVKTAVKLTKPLNMEKMIDIKVAMYDDINDMDSSIRLAR